jgi:hypothetical protein
MNAKFLVIALIALGGLLSGCSQKTESSQSPSTSTIDTSGAQPVLDEPTLDPNWDRVKELVNKL